MNDLDLTHDFDQVNRDLQFYLMKSLTPSNLVQPHSSLTRKCSMDITNLVEEALSEETSAEQSKKLKDLLFKYHTVRAQYPTTIFVCTESVSKDHIEHQEFSVKVVYNQSAWTPQIFSEKSQLTVLTSDRSVSLYSFVCQSLGSYPECPPLDMEKSKEYSLECSVIIALDVQGIEEIEYAATFTQTEIYCCQFEIRLQKDGRKVILQPNQKYRVKIQFSDVHPLYIANEIENKAQDKHDLTVQCSEGNGVDQGSHIIHILYRNL